MTARPAVMLSISLVCIIFSLAIRSQPGLQITAECMTPKRGHFQLRPVDPDAARIIAARRLPRKRPGDDFGEGAAERPDPFREVGIGDRMAAKQGGGRSPAQSCL